MRLGLGIGLGARQVLAAAAPSAPSFRYWRVVSGTTSGGYFELQELELRDRVGGTNLATSSASLSVLSTANGDKNNLIKGVPGFWVGNNSNAFTAQEWVQYDMGAPTAVGEVVLTPNTANRLGQFYVVGSNNLSTWTLLYSSRNLSYTSGVAYAFPLSTIVPDGGAPSYRYIKLEVNSTPDGYAGLGGIELRANAGSFAISVDHTKMVASTEFPGQVARYVLDADDSTYWLSANATPPHSLVYDFGIATGCAELVIKRSTENRYPLTFKVYGSADNSAFTQLKSLSQATWVYGTEYTFSLI